MKTKSRAIIFKRVLYIKMKRTCICLENVKQINVIQITGTGNRAVGFLKETLHYALSSYQAV